MAKISKKTPQTREAAQVTLIAMIPTPMQIAENSVMFRCFQLFQSRFRISSRSLLRS